MVLKWLLMVFEWCLMVSGSMVVFVLLRWSLWYPLAFTGDMVFSRQQLASSCWASDLERGSGPSTAKQCLQGDMMAPSSGLFHTVRSICALWINLSLTLARPGRASGSEAWAWSLVMAKLQATCQYANVANCSCCSRSSAASKIMQQTVCSKQLTFAHMARSSMYSFVADSVFWNLKSWQQPHPQETLRNLRLFEPSRKLVCVSLALAWCRWTSNRVAWHCHARLHLMSKVVVPSHGVPCYQTMKQHTACSWQLSMPVNCRQETSLFCCHEQLILCSEMYFHWRYVRGFSMKRPDFTMQAMNSFCKRYPCKMLSQPKHTSALKNKFTRAPKQPKSMLLKLSG